MTLWKTTLVSGAIALLAACSPQGGNQPAAAAAGNTPDAAATAPAAQAQVTRQTIAPGLYELAYSPRLDAVFVASSGGFGDQAAPSKILRLNPQTLAVEAEIPLERKAFGVTLDDANGRLYVGNTVDTSVTVLDVDAGQVLGVIQLMEKVTRPDGKTGYSHDLRELRLDPASQRLYVTGHSGEGSVLFVVDTASLKLVDTIPGLGEAKAPGLHVDPATKRVYASNLLGELLVIDPAQRAVVQRVQTTAEQPMNIDMDPSGQRLFVTDQGLQMIRSFQEKSIPGFASKHPGNRVLVLDAVSGQELASIPTDAGPLGLIVDAQRKRLHVTNREAGTVSTFDTDTYQRLGTVELPAHPNSLALDAQRNVLYVSIKADKDEGRAAPESVARIALPQ
ncbi:YncE family protein [Verticiella sediminum]|uniref:YncE family protein n=1 Tax=Verticiella sediminum TaxID=1247510 RepID=A0A556B0X0_9BURK|nr:YncE family protein [Verticiella sediminum]TSH98836.1 YncE family protein [Verticiella sediminum]